MIVSGGAAPVAADRPRRCGGSCYVKGALCGPDDLTSVLFAHTTSLPHLPPQSSALASALPPAGLPTAATIPPSLHSLSTMAPPRTVLAVVAVAALVAVTAGSRLGTPPTPAPKVMMVTRGGADCISRWFVTDYVDTTWVWTDVTECCAAPPAPVTTTTTSGGKTCKTTVASCGTYLTPTMKCGRNMCTTTDCVGAPPGLDIAVADAPAAGCPPRPMPMHTRYVKANGERCIKDWSACGAVTAGGKCIWKDCDEFKCKAPCAATKPMPKNMISRSPGKVCSSAWWPVTAKVDNGSDAQSCTWTWKDVEHCHCDTGKPKWEKC
ncbi:hypothetical protein I4F81_009205 [Pyropia yezoensis]|uniref:Uncharacterized protein n=1 Tax=Pyropia yezoensis TaxID=2788 RepID=A0ACC3C8S4_PYRYE|nr:hypothetical protein I4F81_009205 [Neopyropia yezoensis]